MKIIVFGKNGQIGSAIYSKFRFNYKKFTLKYFSSSQSSKKIEKIDFLKPLEIKNLINLEKPDIIINAAAYTNVDLAEIEKRNAYKINAKAPQIIAKECKKKKIFFIHFSTDYVFSGNKKNYTEKNRCNPINYYGKTKLYAEKAILKSKCNYLILRLSSVFGRGKNNFIKKIIKNLKKNKTIKVVDDQIGNLTSVELVMDCLSAYLKNFSDKKNKSNLYNLTSKNSCSRLEVAKYILKNSKFFKKKSKFQILPIKTANLNSLAKRPKNSSLSITKVERDIGIAIKDWQFYLKKYLK